MLTVLGCVLIPHGAAGQTPVPLLVGKSVGQAQEELNRDASEFGLSIQGPRDTAAVIVSQSPVSGVPFSGRLILVRTRLAGPITPGPVTVPDLSGYLLGGAREAASDKGLVLVAGPSPELDARVFWQWPLVGETADLGDPVFVHLRVPSPDDPERSYPVPDLRGRSRDAAALFASQHGFAFQVLDGFGAADTSARVVHQDPPPNTLAPEGAEIGVALLPGQGPALPWWQQPPWTWLLPLLALLLAAWLAVPIVRAVFRAVRAIWPGPGGNDSNVRHIGEVRHVGEVKHVGEVEPLRPRTSPEPKPPGRPSPLKVRPDRPPTHEKEGAPVWPIPESGSVRPFDFLGPYAKEDRAGYFGREKETAQLFNATKASRLVVLHGSAGCGKTSLIQCGLGNQLNDSDWLPLVVRREGDLNESLRRALRSTLPDDATPDRWVDPSTTSWDEVSVLDLVRSAYRAHYRTPYLIFDDIEELLLDAGKAEQQTFFQQVQALVESDVPCKIVISCREEHLRLLERFAGVVPTLVGNQVHMEEPDPDSLGRIIMGTVTWLGLSLAAADHTVPKILEALPDGSDRGNLAGLQVWLDHLWLTALDDRGDSPQDPGAADAVITPGVVGKALGLVVDLVGGAS